MNKYKPLFFILIPLVVCILGCAQPSSYRHITITVRGGEHVRIIQDSFTVGAGLTWTTVLAYVRSCVDYDEGWEPGLQRIGSDTGPELTEYHTYVPVDDDTVVFIQAQEAAQKIEDGISLILHPDVLADPAKPRGIKIKIITADQSPIMLEGFKWKTQLTAEEAAAEELYLYPNCTTKVKIKGKNITELHLGRWKSDGQYADVYRNHIVSLNVQGCSSLKKFDCSGNLLTTLNVQGLTSLEELNCQENKLSSLNVQGLHALRLLGCDGNRLASLNVQGLNLIHLGCSGNLLKSLYVRGLPLEVLYCNSNNLDSLNVRGLPLKKFYCYGNNLAELDVRGLCSLQDLVCDRNELLHLDLQGCSSLRYFICRWNKLISLNNMQDLAALEYMDCSNNEITAIGAGGLTALQILDCKDNQLSFLNVEKCASLQKLQCQRNRLTSLDVRGLSSLKKLHCSSNRLNADAFIKIFTALPERTAADNAECELFTERRDFPECNCKSFASPPALKEAFNAAKDKKHWKLYKENKNGNPDTAV
ncbi:MAG: leucine-rich repeat domain-containing protein [Treponema maltophilum]